MEVSGFPLDLRETPDATRRRSHGPSTSRTLLAHPRTPAHTGQPSWGRVVMLAATAPPHTGRAGQAVVPGIVVLRRRKPPRALTRGWAARPGTDNPPSIARKPPWPTKPRPF